MGNQTWTEYSFVLVRYQHPDGKRLILLGHMRTRTKDKNGNDNPWGLPGGEIHEHNCETALLRARKELFQETGKRIPQKRFVACGIVELKKLKRRIHVFSVSLTEEEYRDEIPPHHEFIEFEWYEENVRKFPFEQMPEGHDVWLPIMLKSDSKETKVRL